MSCSSVFFFPGNCDGRGAEVASGLGGQSLFIESSTGKRLNIWHLPTTGKPKGIVYFLHGNAQSNCSHVPPLGWLPASGYDLYALDYSGYGLSEGSASFDGAVADVISGFKFVEEQAKKEKLDIAVLGQSIGASLAIKAFANLDSKPKLFVLDSAFSGCTRVVRDKLWFLPLINYPVSQLFSCGGDPIDSIAKLTPSKVFIMHCSADRVVEPSHSERLFSAAKAPRQLRIVKDCDHIHALSQQRIRNELLYELGKDLESPEEKDMSCLPGKVATLTNPHCSVSWQVLHRGRSSPEQPGNTLALFKRDIDRQVPAVEMDLRLSEDREVVLFHNKRITDDVVTGPKGMMGKQIEEVSAMNAQKLKYKDSKERLALLREVLQEAAGKNTLLFLDIKGRFDRIARVAIRQASRFRATNQLVVQCDDFEQLELVHKEFPNIATLLRINNADDLERVPNNAPTIVQVDEPLLDSAVALKSKLPIRVLTKNYEADSTPESVQELFQRGTDLVMTER